MAITINAQFNKFVQFAQQQPNAATSTAIARVTGNEDALAGRSISASTTDHVRGLLNWGGRSGTDAEKNNETRRLFREAVAAMFGGEANIPKTVKDVMKLEDYGTAENPSGKPLTARRIMAVKAEVDRIIAVHAAFNNDIGDKLFRCNFNELPQEFQAGLAETVDRLRNVFGEAAVPTPSVISDILNIRFVKNTFENLRDAATAQGRDLTAQEITAAYGGAAFERLATNAVGLAILPKIKARHPDYQNTELSVGSQFMARQPGLQAEINLCKTPDEIAAVLRNREAAINTFVDIAVRSDAACKTVKDKAVAKLATRLGLDERLVEAHVSTRGLSGDAQNLVSAIVNGKAPGCTEPGYDVEAAFDALVDEFVQKRVDACNAIDQLDLAEGVKNRWKAEFLAHADMPRLTPAQLFEVAQSIDVNKFKTAFGKDLPLPIAAAMLNNITNKIIADCGRVTGNPRVLANASVEAMSLYSMLIVAVEAKDPSVAAAIQKAGKFLTSAVAHCEANARNDQTFANAAVFVQALQSRGGTVKKVPVTDQAKFLAVVGKTVDSALAEHGVTDPHVCQGVKNRILERAENVVARATGLKGLSDFLATVKAGIAAIPAKQKEMVAKYSAGLPQETVPFLARLAAMLDWSEKAAAASENIVKNYVEDMKTWRNVAPGSPDAKGLEEVFQRRMDGYLKYAITQEKNFNKEKHPGLCQDFLNDLGRSAAYTVNGTKLAGANLQDRLVHFMNSIKDPKKRKAVSMAVNQQIWGDFTTSIANRVPLVGWKEGMKDESSTDIPGIEKFASRDVMKTGDQLFGAGPMTFDLVVSPDESTVTVHATCNYQVHADVSLKDASVGICKVTQDFVIDLTGEEPAIRDFKIGQTFE